MKIIGVSNLDDETINDVLIAENINAFHAIMITEFLNSKEGPNTTYFHRTVENNYILHVFEP